LVVYPTPRHFNLPIQVCSDIIIKEMKLYWRRIAAEKFYCMGEWSEKLDKGRALKEVPYK
jgi:hypothetical protein